MTANSLPSLLSYPWSVYQVGVHGCQRGSILCDMNGDEAGAVLWLEALAFLVVGSAAAAIISKQSRRPAASICCPLAMRSAPCLACKIELISPSGDVREALCGLPQRAKSHERLLLG